VYLEQTRIGYGLDPETQMGPVPLVSEKQKKRVLGYLEGGEHSGALFRFSRTQ
jgi:acyl-CoA reductase-like NAD-dependent aldehyde dehydrogenase